MRILAEIFGIFALVACILQFFTKEKKFFILFSVAINFLIGMEYLLLGSHSGAYLCFFAVFRYLIYLLKGKNKFFSGAYIPIFFVICNITISIFTYQQWYDILPAISAVSVCIYPWFDNIKLLKICTLLIAPLWVVYDTVIGAWASLVMEIVAFVVEFVIFVIMLKKEQSERTKSTKNDTEQTIENLQDNHQV